MVGGKLLKVGDLIDRVFDVLGVDGFMSATLLKAPLQSRFGFFALAENQEVQVNDPAILACLYAASIPPIAALNPARMSLFLTSLFQARTSTSGTRARAPTATRSWRQRQEAQAARES